MNKSFKNFLLSPLMLLLFFCSNNDTSTDVVATVGNDQIVVSTVDQMIQNQLYESLFGIYYKRKIALEQYLSQFLLSKEAKELGITTDSLLKAVVSNGISDEGLKEFIENNELHLGIPDKNNPLILIDIQTAEGKNALNEAYRKNLIEDFVQTLFKKYNVKITLHPPKPPKKNLTGINKHFKGTLNSKLEIGIISDFDCPACRQKKAFFDELYDSYKNTASFYYVNLSSEVTLPIVISECAATKNKFWEMYDLLFENSPTDSVGYFELAKTLNINQAQIINCLNDLNLRKNIESNFKTLTEEGIIATPTLIVNGRIYYGELSIEKVGDYIEKELDIVGL